MEFSYPWEFDSRRAATMATGGMVATSHPLAARTGLRVLEDGGTAADAAVATAAVLNVVEPHMTGIGGDAFALVHEDGEYAALNASGGAPAGAAIEDYREHTGATDDDGTPVMPADGGLPVTVPGALDGWARLVDRYGSRELGNLLQPAIDYARDGVPVTEYVSHQWHHAADRLRAFDAASERFLAGGEAPAPGQRFANPALADSFETIAAEGVGALYGGDLGETVVETVRDHGGTLSLSDLESHEGEWTEPISTTYRGVEVLEHPPNGQGVVALEALNVAEQFDLDADPADPERLHRLLEATKLGFADGYAHVTDPEAYDVPLDAMLSSEYAAERAGEVGDDAGTYDARAGAWPGTGGVGDETVYLTVVDGDGTAVSLINSVYMSFGSGLVAGGFALQNRGHSFSLDADHANALAPGKRPYHTIIPAMLREDGEFRASWGVMGGSMQPQGHLQVVANLVDSGLNPQKALDAPRFRWLDGRRVALETSRLPDATVEALRERGHEVVAEEAFFERGGHWGGGQFVYRDGEGTLVGGSDPRRDGLAIGY
jgi:gamma-glutamyltranspeptidase/glutathione hydrolase